MLKIDPKNYEAFIRLKGRGKAKGLMNEFLMSGHLSRTNPLIINEDDSWVFYIDKRKRNAYGNYGLKFFRDTERFNEYAKDFKHYIAYAKRNIIPRYSKIPAQMTKQEFKSTIKKISEFWKFYGMTEYVFHDFAYAKMIETKDKTLRNHLKNLDRLKLAGRKIFNELAFIGGSVDNILKYVSARYLKNEDDGYFLYFDEIVDLFDGTNPNQKLIHQRKLAYALQGKNHFAFGESKKLAKLFGKYHELELDKSRNKLHGIIANKGIAVGRVVIAPMWDKSEAAGIERKMKKGDILMVQSTNPELIGLCHKAGAIVTNQGGMLSHAAIISRELNIPCIVGTINATKIFKSGDLVKVDATNGTVQRINDEKI